MKYERAIREIEFTKKRLQQEFDDKLEVDQQNKRQLERRVNVTCSLYKSLKQVLVDTHRHAKTHTHTHALFSFQFVFVSNISVFVCLRGGWKTIFEGFSARSHQLIIKL